MINIDFRLVGEKSQLLVQVNLSCFWLWLHKSIHGSKSGSNADGTSDGHIKEILWIYGLTDHDKLKDEHVFIKHMNMNVSTMEDGCCFPPQTLFQHPVRWLLDELFCICTHHGDTVYIISHLNKML